MRDQTVNFISSMFGAAYLQDDIMEGSVKAEEYIFALLWESDKSLECNEKFRLLLMKRKTLEEKDEHKGCTWEGDARVIFGVNFKDHACQNPEESRLKEYHFYDVAWDSSLSDSGGWKREVKLLGKGCAGCPMCYQMERVAHFKTLQGILKADYKHNLRNGKYSRDRLWEPQEDRFKSYTNAYCKEKYVSGSPANVRENPLRPDWQRNKTKTIPLVDSIWIAQPKVSVT